MAARGIRSVWESLSGAGGNKYVDLASPSINMATTNIVITCWMKILGPTTSGTRGQIPFHVFNGSTAGAMFFTNSASSPFDMGLKVFSTGETTYGSWSVATGESWFYVAMWDASTATWTAYASKDGDASVGSPASSPAAQTAGTLNQLRVGGVSFTFDWGCNAEVTDLCVATPATLPDATALFAQQNSDPITFSNPYARLSLLSTASYADSTGNGHDGTAVGALANGTMDPVDLQSGGGVDPTPIQIRLRGHAA